MVRFTVYEPIMVLALIKSHSFSAFLTFYFNDPFLCQNPPRILQFLRLSSASVCFPDYKILTRHFVQCLYLVCLLFLLLFLGFGKEDKRA